MLIKRASRKGSALGNLSQDVATRSSLWTKFVMTISFDFPLLDLSLGKRNNLSEFYGFSQATIWQVPSSRWLWILIMVQCNMTLRGHNPHDSQHGRLSHVCHCLSCLWGFAWNPQKKNQKKVLKERSNGHQHSQVPAVQLWWVGLNPPPSLVHSSSK